MCRAMAMPFRRAAPDEDGGFKKGQLPDQFGPRAAFRLGRCQTHRREGCRLRKALPGAKCDEPAHVVVARNGMAALSLRVPSRHGNLALNGDRRDRQKGLGSSEWKHQISTTCCPWVVMIWRVCLTRRAGTTASSAVVLSSLRAAPWPCFAHPGFGPRTGQFRTSAQCRCLSAREAAPMGRGLQGCQR